MMKTCNRCGFTKENPLPPKWATIQKELDAACSKLDEAAAAMERAARKMFDDN